jgi:NADH-quinone oxidoreductase subunit I
LSCFSRDGCIVDYAKLPLEIAYGQATLNPTVVAESKKVALPVWTKAPEAPKAETAQPAVPPAPTA